MKTPLAWKNLVHNKVRTAVALAGVGFAVILIFMQMGFKGAVKKTATQIYDALEFDLMLRSPTYLHLTDPRTFPRERIYQAASLPGVEASRPFYLGLTEWQAPQPPDAKLGDWQGEWRGIICMGTDPADPAFRPAEIREKVKNLTDSSFLLIDRKSKSDFGPSNGERFGELDIGVKTVLGRERFQIVDTFELGTGLAANGACLTNPNGFAKACYWQPLQQVNLGLVTLTPGADIHQVQNAIQQLLGPVQLEGPPTATPADVEVLTRDEVRVREEKRWVKETPLGFIFEIGVYVALFVGVAIVYQVLSTDIANMMGEYATLKAMGYTNGYLTSVVLQQSVLLALVGYVPSILISWALYYIVSSASGMPMAMTWQIASIVLGLAILMCVLSGLAALRKLFQADPADLF
ncbi:FtsX-like permease family protein [Adhaeretor mobilis]|uniref:FtsX-like permease family protein n=1 Tax=Adhaeretor mobilis TaxID=1930276 RepID=A0A517MT49_9BACT|nr:FtsX-like permease family protein [Adhaeretor mobilis]QDS98055.1 FtsX-like permease family protein [Adhaeretor mobilis]